MKRWGTYRYVPHDRAAYYIARGWQPFDLGAHHRCYAVGMFKAARRSGRGA